MRIWISPFGGLDNPPAADGRKVVIADTDHLCGICGNRAWVWKSFMRGENPIFMDQYDNSYNLEGGDYDPNNPNDVSLRRNMGYTRVYATRMNLAAMTPRGDLSSTGYAWPIRWPTVQSIWSMRRMADRSRSTYRTPGAVNVEWFNPAMGAQWSAWR